MDKGSGQGGATILAGKEGERQGLAGILEEGDKRCVWGGEGGKEKEGQSKERTRRNTIDGKDLYKGRERVEGK